MTENQNYMRYSIVFEKCNDGGYIAYVPNLPVCFSVGNTLLEVKSNIKEAIELYLEEINQHKKLGEI